MVCAVPCWGDAHARHSQPEPNAASTHCWPRDLFRRLRRRCRTTPSRPPRRRPYRRRAKLEFSGPCPELPRIETTEYFCMLIDFALKCTLITLDGEFRTLSNGSSRI